MNLVERHWDDAYGLLGAIGQEAGSHGDVFLVCEMFLGLRDEMSKAERSGERPVNLLRRVWRFVEDRRPEIQGFADVNTRTAGKLIAYTRSADCIHKRRKRQHG